MYRDKQHVAENDRRYTQAERLIVDREFERASVVGAEALESLKDIFILVSDRDNRITELQEIMESQQEATQVAEKEMASVGSEYLLANYKEIFKKNHPGVHGPAVQSPRVKCIGSSGDHLVFLLSCIERIQRHSSEFRLSYQYDPASGKWSIYRERK